MKVWVLVEEHLGEGQHTLGIYGTEEKGVSAAKAYMQKQIDFYEDRITTPDDPQKIVYHKDPASNSWVEEYCVSGMQFRHTWVRLLEYQVG